MWDLFQKEVTRQFNLVSGDLELEGIRYGYSSMGTKIVLNDPYQSSVSRMIIVGGILALCPYYVWKLFLIYRKVGEITEDQSLLNCSEMRFLIVLGIMALITSAIHNADNFFHIVDYYGAAFMYHGIFFILDIGLYFWASVATALFLGITRLIENKGSSLISFILIIFYCYMIWVAPIIHYSVEPMKAYSNFANFTIIAEASCEVILNLYSLHLLVRSFIQNRENSVGSYNYHQLPTSESEVFELTLREDVAHPEPLRRRSKEYK